MKRIFTPLTALVCSCVMSFNSFGQLTPTSPSLVSTIISNQFNTNSEDFTGDFNWSSGGSGQLESTPIVSGTPKMLVTQTFNLANNATDLAWGFSLGGTLNVTSYQVKLLYPGHTTLTTALSLGSGSSLATSGNVITFSVPKPAEIANAVPFKLVILFDVSAPGSSDSKILTLDNFSSNALAAQIPLPVRFSSFNAKTLGSGVNLTWNVGLEQGVSNYEIERSADGRSFTKIASVTANGLGSYTFTDAKPLSTGYYRIKTVDESGKITYSAVVFLKGGTAVVMLKAFLSNPITLTVQHDAAQSGSLISVSAADGRLVKSLKPVAGSQQSTVDLSTVKPGMYLVRFDNSNGVSGTIKVIKP